VAGDRTTVLADDEIVVEVRVPRPSTATKTSFIKFALRKSIDFPVVNCAAAIASRRGVVTAARICLNSVYNLPYRVRKAEAYLIGRRLDESSAEAAAGAGTEDAFPLLNNRYKIQIARTLVKRAILGCRPEGR
jgi:xanthine dehydrogenase YagS FAD-binding subunit